ncbi:MAG: minor capsid protein, partial [Thermoanaerobaculia bacterium]
GGVMGLELMGVGGHFYLTDPNYLAVLDGHAAQLTTLGRPVSLIDTTVNHLAVDIPAARGAGGNPIMALGDLIMGRVATRNSAIAITEETRATAWGQHWTYAENRVQRTQYWTRLDERVCEICRPYHGQIYRTDSIPRDASIPLHIRCRCYFLPVLVDWTRPPEIWRGH